MPTKKSDSNTPENDDSLPEQEQPAFSADNRGDEHQEDARLAEMRLGLDAEQPKSAPFVNTASLGEFFKKVTDKLRPISINSSKALDETPETPAAQVPPAQPVPGVTRKLFPFDQHEPFPGSLPPPPPEVKPASPPTGNLDRRPATTNLPPRATTGGLTPRPPSGSGTTPLGPKKPAVSTNQLNKLAQKLETQSGAPTPLSRLQKRSDQKLLPGRFEKDKQFGYQDDLKNPFVDDDEQVVDGGEQSLAAKIKNGSVPAETLRLLITASMSEAEVLAICSELNIDWESVPGDYREEKTQYLIDYFNNHETHLDFKEVATNVRSQLPSEDQHDWGDSDARLKQLQESLGGSETAPQLEQEEQKPLSFMERLREDFAQASPLQKALVIGLSLIVLALVVAIGLVLFPLNMPAAPAPRFTAMPSDLPSPMALALPGGWTFNLNPGVVQDGNWKPDGPEWLQGTEICRVVSLPWNRQLDAVYSTLQPGDELLLTMTNLDQLHFKVTDLMSTDLMDFDSDDLSQIATATSPCLAVVLTKEDATQARQLIVAEPVLVAPWQTAITATPVVSPTPNPAFPTVTVPPTQKP